MISHFHTKWKHTEDFGLFSSLLQLPHSWSVQIWKISAQGLSLVWLGLACKQKVYSKEVLYLHQVIIQASLK